MEENEYITDEYSLPEAGTNDNVEAAEEETAVSESPKAPQNVDGLSLSEINSFLGKNFKDKDTALKAIKDTFNFVGKRKEDVVKSVDTSGFISKEQYDNDMFFSKNPEYDTPATKKLINALAKSEGASLSDVVNSDDFKEVYGGYKGYKESQTKKSVLETNPRLAQSKSKLQEASTAMSAGNKSLAEKLAVESVMEANSEIFAK